MKLTSYILLLLITITLGCFSAFAQQKDRWIFIGQDVDGTVFYLDRTSREASGDTIRVWYKNVFRDGSFRISLSEWRCSEKKYFHLDSTAYDPTGVVIDTSQGTAWINVIPDAISEALYKAICGDVSNKSSKAITTNKKVAQIIVRKANLRSSPSISSGILQQANLGERFSLVDEQPISGWYQVAIAETNEIAWIHGNNIKLLDAANKSNTKKQKKKRQN